MNKQEKNDYILELESLYDEYLQKTEKRGISYGEIAYIQGLKKQDLDSLYNEILEALKIA